MNFWTLFRSPCPGPKKHERARAPQKQMSRGWHVPHVFSANKFQVDAATASYVTHYTATYRVLREGRPGRNDVSHLLTEEVFFIFYHVLFSIFFFFFQSRKDEELFENGNNLLNTFSILAFVSVHPFRYPDSDDVSAQSVRITSTKSTAIRWNRYNTPPSNIGRQA